LQVIVIGTTRVLHRWGTDRMRKRGDVVSAPPPG
jgi:hypothetical protein